MSLQATYICVSTRTKIVALMVAEIRCQVCMIVNQYYCIITNYVYQNLMTIMTYIQSCYDNYRNTFKSGQSLAINVHAYPYTHLTGMYKLSKHTMEVTADIVFYLLFPTLHDHEPLLLMHNTVLVSSCIYRQRLNPEALSIYTMSCIIANMLYIIIVCLPR